MPSTASAVAARTFPALGTFATLLVAAPDALARRTTCSPRS